MAEATNVRESRTNAALVPNKPVTKPPIAAPRVSITDQVTAAMALAGTNSRSETIDGIAAVFAGSKNVENARALFPEVRFELGNIFEITAHDHQFDYSFVHDLFEHLSAQGLNAAVRELCRVTRQGICAGFFNMDEIPEHVVQPIEDYHWNTLSLQRMKELFAEGGFTGQIVHLATFLRQQVGSDETHNPNAYTFFLWRAGV